MWCQHACFDPLPPPELAAHVDRDVADRALPRRRLATVLVVLASVVLFLGIFAVWAERQALDSSEWTNTSSELLEQETIRNALALYLVDELYANVDVAAELRTVLPPEFQSLAGPAAGGLREFAERAARRLLASPRVQQAWEDINRETHEQFVDVVEDKGNPAVTTAGGEVVLDLQPLVQQLSDRAGLGGKITQNIPPDAGQLVIMRSDQLDAAQKVTNVIQGLAFVLPLLWLALAALAIYLARGRRRRTLRVVALGAVAAGIVVLLGRGAAGDAVTNALAKTAAVRPAVEDTWTVSTSLLQDIAQSTITVALLLLLVAWLAGETRPATALRRAAAPYMRERPDLTYGFVALIYLLLVVWAPARIFTQPLPLLLIAVLMIFGTEVLRRETEREFPNATLGGAGIRESISSWWSGRRSRTGGAAVRRGGTGGRPGASGCPARARSPEPGGVRSAQGGAARLSSSMRITFVGHSTVLIELDGVRILTDPLLRRPVRPCQAPRASGRPRPDRRGRPRAGVAHPPRPPRPAVAPEAPRRPDRRGAARGAAARATAGRAGKGGRGRRAALARGARDPGHARRPPPRPHPPSRAGRDRVLDHRARSGSTSRATPTSSPGCGTWPAASTWPSCRSGAGAPSSARVISTPYAQPRRSSCLRPASRSRSTGAPST